MSTTPPPPGAADGNGNGNNVNAWRNSVSQSYRNEEVKEIAKFLAQLEPGASTTSKMSLAMRFEDALFKTAKSIEDYRKKIKKRLTKLQKNYVPDTEEQKKGNSAEQLLLELRHKYSESLRYIATNASKAIDDVRERSGTERSIQLQQHTDSTKQWAKELGVLQDPPPPNTLSEEYLRKLMEHLGRRVENIRQYVVKHAEPDLFLQETLERKDKDLSPKASQLLAKILTKRIQQLQNSTSASSAAATAQDNNSNHSNSTASTNPTATTTTATTTPTTTTFDAMTVLQESLERAQATLPPPTRNNSNEIPNALKHLDKMRAASTALMAYLAIPDRKTTAPPNSLAKAYNTTTEGMDFVLKVVQKQKSMSTKDSSGVTLEDAWTKVLELLEVVDTNNDTNNSINNHNNKKPKLDHIPPVTKSRILLTPKRKTPTNLLPALKRKRATLVRPNLNGRGSHLILDFGKAFRMTIYVCPLLVTIRAMTEKEESSNQTTTRNNSSSSNNNNNTTTTRSSSNNSNLGGTSWTPLYHGLAEKDDLSVWGVTGSYEAVGHAVEERLRDASNHATHVLRKCFRNHVKDKTTEFEVELLEASALLEFLQLARTTFIPNWQDDDDAH